MMVFDAVHHKKGDYIMFKTLVSIAIPLSLTIAAPVVAQTMTAADVGVEPLAGMSAADYVKQAAASDNFEIQAGRIAVSKSRREDIKGFAKQMIADHTESSKSIGAALNNRDRKIAPPSMALNSADKAKIDLLRKAPKGTFDQLYLQQQLEAHQSAWALHKGYADNGTDPALKQVATTIVPVVERHLAMVKGMTGSM